ncbi:MAG TPA: MBL fold metallo-hydrolase [Stellaceae bacterium]|nr:MBL fold metallo-hydrolase [Stellaceae bacterium]
MDIVESRQADSLILRPIGRIDSLTSAEFQARLLAAVSSGAAVCVVDVSEVEFISTAGLRALFQAARTKGKEQRLAVACPNEVVREIFRIARFSLVFPIFATVEDAVAGRAAQSGASEPHETAGSPESVVVRFWGTRGSLPAPLGERAVRAKLRRALLAARGHTLETPEAVDAFIDRALPFSVRGTFGGNTSCVEIVTGGDEYLLCDLGTGLREFGNRVIAEPAAGRKHCFNIFQSHPHWDHIMGFPFFAPAYIPGNRIRIFGCHDVLREALEKQQSDPCFPVDFHALSAAIEFVRLDPGQTVEVAGFSVTPLNQFHAGDSYGYRFSRGAKTIVYSTDCEHKYLALDDSYPFVEFYRNADLLIFDAMYSLADMISVKEDWGHSSNIVAVELAQAAKVKRLVLFHHEPAYDDARIESVLSDTIRFEELSRRGHKVEVISAYDGLELTI